MSSPKTETGCPNACRTTRHVGLSCALPTLSSRWLKKLWQVSIDRDIWDLSIERLVHFLHWCTFLLKVVNATSLGILMAVFDIDLIAGASLHNIYHCPILPEHSYVISKLTEPVKTSPITEPASWKPPLKESFIWFSMGWPIFQLLYTFK